MKSSSRLIGAADVADRAAALEEAAKREDGESILAAHSALMADYRAAARAAGAAAGAGGDPGSAAEPEGGVLEFEPKEY